MIKELRVDPTTRSRLGAHSLAQLRRNLHPGNCQTCGQALGRSEAPALVVLQTGTDRASATVHHQGCQEPGWSTGDTPARTHLTWYAGGLVTTRGELPAVVVNPSYEEARLLADGGEWRFGQLEEFGAIGLSGVDALDERPVTDLRALLCADRLLLDAPGHPVGPWWLPIDPDDEFGYAALRVGKVLVVLTTADDARTAMTPGHFSKVLAHPGSLAGMVTVSFAPELQVPRPDDLDPDLRIEVFANAAVRIEEALGEDPSDECFQAALAAADGDDQLIRELEDRERLFACLLLTEFYTLTTGSGPSADAAPRPREGTHVVLPSAERARAWAEVFAAVCGPAGTSVHVLDGGDDGYLGDIVLGTAPRLAEAAATSPVERGWTALFVDVDAEELDDELVERYRRVLTV